MSNKTNIHVPRLLVAVATIAATMLVCATAQAGNPPVKLVQAGHIGKEGTGPGEFIYPAGAAGAPNGNIYVLDNGNKRVQEITPSGEFVLMFGQGVNAKGGTTCTKAEEAECRVGIQGSEAGQFTNEHSVTVASTGNVYVAEGVSGGRRVQEFDSGGHFLLEIGKGVNKTTKTNTCTETEISNCGAPEAFSTQKEGEHEVVNFGKESRDNIIAAGGAGDLLYVGEPSRIQELSASGKWVGEIPVAGEIGSIAVDDATGHIFFAYVGSAVIHGLESSGKEALQIVVKPKVLGHTVEQVWKLAVDAGSHLAVTVRESTGSVGFLYEDTTGKQLPGFTMLIVASPGMGFDTKSELFIAGENVGDVLVYKPVPVAELVLNPPKCVEGADVETSVKLDCTLEGEVNPYDVSKTEVWFGWGRERNGKCFPEETLTSPALLPAGEQLEGVSAVVAEGLRPNQTFCDQVLGEDANVQPPEVPVAEALTSANGPLTFNTPFAHAKVVGRPTASFITSSSVDMSGELNPENAQTEYFFEYAPVKHSGEKPLEEHCANGTREETCEGVSVTSSNASKLYGKVPTQVEANGLQPAMTYEFRLAAVNGAGETVCDEQASKCVNGEFTTASLPAVEAQLGAEPEPIDVTATGATVTGEVDPDGAPATYRFELGEWAGAATQLGVVSSGSVPAFDTFVTETLALTGLQPGTEYAYRITITGGYSEALSATGRFKTASLSEALTSPAPPPQLGLPPFQFPTQAPQHEGKPPLTPAQRLTQELKTCREKRSKKQRAGCERSAREKYGPTQNKKKKPKKK